MDLPKSLKFSSGFTLMELIVVIAVIGILSSIAVISFGTIQASARDAQRQQIVTGIQTALERYYGENQTYPTSSWGNMFTNANGAGTGICGTNGVTSWGQGTTCPPGFFLSSIPRDPKPGCTAGMGSGPNAQTWQPCSSSTNPYYRYDASCSGGSCESYTITLGKESGGTVIFRSPQ